MKKILFVLVVSLFTSCTDKEKEAEFQNRITELETQLDECQNGADKLLAKVKIAFESEDYLIVKTIFNSIKDRHPEAPEYKEAKSLYDQVVALEEKKRKEAERKAEKEEKETRLKAEKKKQEQLAALKKLKKKFDDISGVTWYEQPYYTHYTNSNLTSIYMGSNDSHRWLRLTMSYKGEDWIFFDKAYLSYDGNTKEIIFDKYKNKKTDNEAGAVWEWIDLTVTKDVEAFFREFAKSKNAKMRLSGKYTKTRSLTYNERKGILDVLSGYDALEDGVK